MVITAPRPGAGAGPRERRDCGDLAIRIARDGTWWHEGSPIGRPGLVRLFASVLVRGEDGGYWLETPVERARITVEDVPFVAVEVTSLGEGRGRVLELRTNLDETVVIDRDHPLRAVTGADGTTLVYATVRPGLEARLLTQPFYALVEMALAEQPPGAAELAIWSSGERFVLGEVAPEDA
jgi:hypothetical protein